MSFSLSQDKIELTIKKTIDIKEFKLIVKKEKIDVRKIFLNCINVEKEKEIKFLLETGLCDFLDDDFLNMIFQTYYISFDIMKLLIDKGFKLDLSLEKNKKSAYEFFIDKAESNENENNLRFYFDKGFNLNYNNCGSKMLLAAALNGCKKIVEFVLSTSQCNVNFKDCDDSTALIYASNHGHREIVELLLATGQCNVNLQNQDGYTALIYATKEGYADIIELLLATGQCDLDLQNQDGDTAFMITLEEERYNIIDIFLNHFDYSKILYSIIKGHYGSNVADFITSKI